MCINLTTKNILIKFIKNYLSRDGRDVITSWSEDIFMAMRVFLFLLAPFRRLPIIRRTGDSSDEERNRAIPLVPETIRRERLAGRSDSNRHHHGGRRSAAA